MQGRGAVAEPSKEQQRIRDELREEIREARGILKDLRREIKDARTLGPLLVKEQLEAEVWEQVDKLGKVTAKQMELSVAKVIAEFDRLSDLLMGRTRRDRRTGKPSIPDLIDQIARGDE